MKEEIYTIPVMDAFNEECECAFCAMERRLEENTIAYVLSPSYMESDVREQTNRLGFCKDHMRRLSGQKNILGLALMVQSYMEKQRADLDHIMHTSAHHNPFQSKRNNAAPLIQYRNTLASSCFICHRIDETMERYLKTFFFLWKKEPEFAEKVLSGKGFCLSHFVLLYQRCGEFLSGNKIEDFRARIRQCQEQNMDRIKEDLEWFIQKFDYRFRDEPWKNSKDALPRAVTKINSQFLD